MSQTFKGILTYFVLILLTLGGIRIYDYVTKNPVPVDRMEDPRITELNKRIDSVLDSVAMYKKQSSDNFKSALMSLDSMKTDHKKSNNEHKVLKNTPDAGLIHYRDSVRKANGL